MLRVLVEVWMTMVYRVMHRVAIDRSTSSGNSIRHCIPMVCHGGLVLTALRWNSKTQITVRLLLMKITVWNGGALYCLKSWTNQWSPRWTQRESESPWYATESMRNCEVAVSRTSCHIEWFDQQAPTRYFAVSAPHKSQKYRFNIILGCRETQMNDCIERNTNRPVERWS